MFETNELSEREQEVLRLVATGASNKEIAQELFISTNTVKVHLRNIYSKLDVASRTEAAMYAVNSGLVTTSSEKSKSSEGDSGLGESLLTDSLASEDTTNRKRRRVFIWSLAGLFLLAIVLGGILVTRSNNPTDLAQLSSPAEIQKWKIVESMPTPRYGLAIASIGNALYAIGGQTENEIIGVNEYFSPEINQWIVKSTKPTPASEISAVVIGGNIYVPGGKLNTGDVTNILEIYDPRTDKWTRGADLPIPLSAYGIASHEGKAYLFGGWDGVNYQDRVFEYDPRSDEWRDITNMDHPRGYLGVVSAGERIYVMGGFDGESLLDINQVFLPANMGTQEGLWEADQPLPVGMSGMGVTSIADIIYLFGGKRGDETISNALAYFPSDQEWRSIDDPLVNIGELPGCVSQGTQIYVFGGNSESGTTSTSQVYQAIFTISFPVIVK